MFLLALFVVRASGAAYTSPGSAIDNVQNYSSSPFYSMDGAYNQRFPTPVYLKGPSIGAAECQMVVDSAIWTQCSFRNNCQNLTANDIRPSVILELSTRTDANYADTCKGYIDSAFGKYRQQVSGAVVSTNFPVATRPASYNQQQIIENSLSYWNQVPEYEYQEKMRQYQLENMQRQTGGMAQLVPTQMPSTFADLSFTERMEALREGWHDPAVKDGKSSYFSFRNPDGSSKLETDAAKQERQNEALAAQNDIEVEREELLKKTNIEEWCKQYPKKCIEDNEYSNYLKNKNHEEWCEKYTLKCDKEKLEKQKEDKKKELLANWNDENVEAYCREYPEDAICVKYYEDERWEEEQRIQKEKEDADRAAETERNNTNARIREAEIKARTSPVTPSAPRDEALPPTPLSEAEKQFLQQLAEQIGNKMQ